MRAAVESWWEHVAALTSGTIRLWWRVLPTVLVIQAIAFTGLMDDGSHQLHFLLQRLRIFIRYRSHGHPQWQAIRIGGRFRLGLGWG